MINTNNIPPVHVIGAGLAGCEAAWQLANAGIEVRLYEQKPVSYSPAHHYPGFAELVCSNSLKAARIESAAGMLKEEMRYFGSLTMQAAASCSVGAGGALAVDREKFSDYITEKIKQHPLITVVEGEVTSLPEGNVIVAAGPLCSKALTDHLQQAVLGEVYLNFFDAAAPIVTAESVDMEYAFAAARYDRGDADYINCPMNKEEYEAFHHQLVHAESVVLKEFEQTELQVYEGCMPVEVMAKRGENTIRFGPLKPVGLRDPKTGHRPWACVQLRKENAEGSLYNLVGFQTNLKFGEQKRVFSMIPALHRAEFVRYGVMHRNTFINSPRLLNEFSQMRAHENIFFAGQITGVEGYIESAASGIWAGYNMARRLQGKALFALPKTSMLGALMAYISDETVADFQPMGSNMGILPQLDEVIRDKKERYLKLATIGLTALKDLLESEGI